MDPAAHLDLRFVFSVLVACSTVAGQERAPPPGAAPNQAMQAVVVETSRYRESASTAGVDLDRTPLGPIPLIVRLPPGSFGGARWDDWSAVFTPGRVSQKEKNSVFPVGLVDAKELSAGAPMALDRVLARTQPEFGLGSRQDSLAAPAFLQSVRRRGFGDALLLLDGAPLSDPWGGHPRWSEVRPQGLIRVELVPAGGAMSWGDGASGGVTQLFSTPPAGRRMMRRASPLAATVNASAQGEPVSLVSLGSEQRLERRGEVTFLVGEAGTHCLDFRWIEPRDTGGAEVSGRAYGSDGESVLSTGQRGVIDRRAWSRHQTIQARWRRPFRGAGELLAAVRASRDRRGEGTDYQQEGTTGIAASVVLTDSPRTGFTWTGVAYAERREADRRWSWVNEARTAETPVLDQFAIPSVAAGALWSGAWWHTGDARTMAGADLRLVQGELKEYREPVAGTFRRVSQAGGNQGQWGVYASHNRALSSVLRSTFGARLDAWRDGGAFQRQHSLDSVRVIEDRRFGARSALELSAGAGAGLVWHAKDHLHFRLNGQQGFRRPSLEERFQDIGYHDTLIIANPSLRRERAASLEGSVNGSVTPHLSWDVAVFASQRHDAIGWRDLPRNPSAGPEWAAAPASFQMGSRTNFDRVDEVGTKLAGRWEATRQVTLEGAIIWNEATLAKLAASPDLEGMTPPQTPRRVATLTAVWRVSKACEFRLAARSTGRAFVDVENTRALRGVGVVDVATRVTVTRRVQVQIGVDNVGDAKVQIDRNNAGLLYLGASRRLWLSSELSW